MSILRSCFLLSVTILHMGFCQNISVIKRIRECFTQEHTALCLKEKALDVINETIISDKPFNIYGLVDIIKDPSYKQNITEEYLPTDINQRSDAINQMLYDKVEEFVESRSMKINLANIFEGE